MSDTSTNLLTGFQATTTKGGDLLGDATLLSGETTEDSGVSFSNVLNQAQSHQANGLIDDTTRFAERAGRPSRGPETTQTLGVTEQSSQNEHGATRARPITVDDTSLDTGRPVSRTPIHEDVNGSGGHQAIETLDGSSDGAGLVKPVSTAHQMIAPAELSNTNPSNELRIVELSPQDSEAIETLPVAQDEIDSTLRATVEGRASDTLTLGEGSDESLSGRLETESAPAIQIQNLESVKTASQGTDEILAPAVAPLTQTTKSEPIGLGVATSRESADTASLLSAAAGIQVSANTNMNSGQQPVVSAADVANRLNPQSVVSNAAVTPQQIVVDPTVDAGADVEKLTTIAGIQSVQVGISGMVQTSKAATATSVTTPADSISQNVGSVTSLGAGLASNSVVTNEQALSGASGVLNNNSLSVASNIPVVAAKEPAAVVNVMNGTNNLSVADAANAVKASMTTPTQVVANDSSPTVSLNPLLDNMLSAPASGIVTAPILAKADLTGTPLVQTPLNVPLLTPAATDAMAGNVRWMVGEGVQNAVVNVSPQGMGPISVQIGIEKEQMSISIIASQVNTREALESMLPRLRDQLSTQGVDTVRVDISDGRGERPSNFSGFERQSMGYTTAENNQSSQQRNADAQEQEHTLTEHADSQVNESGERMLSESERERVDELKNSSSHSSVKNVSISHGYDLYV